MCSKLVCALPCSTYFLSLHSFTSVVLIKQSRDVGLRICLEERYAPLSVAEIDSTDSCFSLVLETLCVLSAAAQCASKRLLYCVFFLKNTFLVVMC